MMFQSYALYPHMTLFDNMAFGLKLAKRNRNEIRNRVYRAATLAQIQHLLERLPKELSVGGFFADDPQRQAAYIAASTRITPTPRR